MIDVRKCERHRLHYDLKWGCPWCRDDPEPGTLSIHLGEDVYEAPAPIPCKALDAMLDWFRRLAKKQ